MRVSAPSSTTWKFENVKKQPSPGTDPARQIYINGIPAELERKNIRSVRLRICRYTGDVKISAPKRVSLKEIQAFAISKSDWIKKHQNIIRNRKIDPPKEYITGEIHYLFGKSYTLQVTEITGKPSATIINDHLLLKVRPGSEAARRRAVLYEWYKDRLIEIMPGYIRKYEAEMGVKVKEFAVKKAKSGWGACNRKKGSIWINIELARHPLEHVEYLVVHEMAHFLEGGHGAAFYACMDKFMPTWRIVRKELKKIPDCGLCQ